MQQIYHLLKTVNLAVDKGTKETGKADGCQGFRKMEILRADFIATNRKHKLHIWRFQNIPHSS